MKWITVSPGVKMCDEDGNNCVTNDRLRWKGGFSDNGSRWVDLTNPREGKQGGLFFRHADGNQWYFPSPQAREPRAGRRGTVSAIRCRAGNNTVLILSLAPLKQEVRSGLAFKHPA